MTRRTTMHRVVAVGILLLFAAPVLACLWDVDTIMQERSRFPTALELITGKFLRHSPEFYRWRIADRELKLKTDPDNLGYYDDLAVAHSKIGDHARAIDVMLEKERRKPGQYETYANLGTFYIFTGDLDQSLLYINKALAINPDAHFGREKYQKLLVEYLRERKEKGTLAFPLIDTSKDLPTLEGFEGGFEAFLEKSELRYDRREMHHRTAAIQAVLGMMRFADYKNPILLESLADLLEGAHYPMPEGGYFRLNDIDGKQLAARALLAASYHATDPDVLAKYRKLAVGTLHMQSPGPGGNHLETAALEKAFELERAEADAWYAKLRTEEIDWIASGKNPEVEFAKRYAADPAIEFDASPVAPTDSMQWRRQLAVILLVPSCLTLAGIVIFKSFSWFMASMRSVLK